MNLEIVMQLRTSYIACGLKETTFKPPKIEFPSFELPSLLEVDLLVFVLGEVKKSTGTGLPALALRHLPYKRLLRGLEFYA